MIPKTSLKGVETVVFLPNAFISCSLNALKNCKSIISPFKSLRIFLPNGRVCVAVSSTFNDDAGGSNKSKVTFGLLTLATPALTPSNANIPPTSIPEITLSIGSVVGSTISVISFNINAGNNPGNKVKAPIVPAATPPVTIPSFLVVGTNPNKVKPNNFEPVLIDCLSTKGWFSITFSSTTIVNLF